MERALSEMLRKFYTVETVFETEIIHYREEMAHIYELEVPFSKKGSASFVMYEMMNCMSDSDLEFYGKTITDIAEDVEFLVDSFNSLKRTFGS